MRTNLIATAVSAAFAIALVSMASPVVAESGSGLSRAEVQKQCSDWKKTHEWSEAYGWQLKAGVSGPAESAKTRGEIQAETEAFLSNHRWDEATSRYVSLTGPRDVSTMTREQVKKEAAEFNRTHVWDEAASAFVPCMP